MIPTLPFGETGHESTRTIFGAAALGKLDQSEADKTIELLIKRGVNHIDTAAGYGDSELRLGPWMKTHRDQFFLATKTTERTRQEAYDSIQRSLERLQTDHVDLIQLHNLVDEVQWRQAFGTDGALEAVMRAREDGMTRFVGVTGHGVSVVRKHIQSLERFDFNSVLFPYNYPMMQNPRYAADVAELFSICRERGVAMQTIKSIAQANWEVWDQREFTWYEPLKDQKDIDTAVHWVLGEPDVFLITASDPQLLPKVLDAAERFVDRPSDSAMEHLVRARGLEPLFV